MIPREVGNIDALLQECTMVQGLLGEGPSQGMRIDNTHLRLCTNTTRKW